MSLWFVSPGGDEAALRVGAVSEVSIQELPQRVLQPARGQRSLHLFRLSDCEPRNLLDLTWIKANVWILCWYSRTPPDQALFLVFQSRFPQIFVRSTDVDRTLMSAEANLAGLSTSYHSPTPWCSKYSSSSTQLVSFFRSLPARRSTGVQTQPCVAAHSRAHGSAERREGWLPTEILFFKVFWHKFSCLLIIFLLFSLWKLLSFPLEDCPRYKQLMNETEHSGEYINITTTYKVPVLNIYLNLF